MQTFTRICMIDYDIKDSKGHVIFRLKKGVEYLTSSVSNDCVTIFTKYWIEVPSNIFFAAAVEFTSEDTD